MRQNENFLISEYLEMGGSKPGTESEQDHGLALEDETQEPAYYKVIMHNDDYTPMDFVIFVLKKFFGKTEHEATQIMLDVHNKGFGLAGVYSYEVAETKVAQVNQYAKSNQYPLKTSCEEV